MTHPSFLFSWRKKKKKKSTMKISPVSFSCWALVKLDQWDSEVKPEIFLRPIIVRRRFRVAQKSVSFQNYKKAHRPGCQDFLNVVYCNVDLLSFVFLLFRAVFCSSLAMDCCSWFVVAYSSSISGRGWFEFLHFRVGYRWFGRENDEWLSHNVILKCSSEKQFGGFRIMR